MEPPKYDGARLERFTDIAAQAGQDWIGLLILSMLIDMVVASVLMSLGMMMLPPNVVSLPFKLVFFATIDGWRLVSGGLVRTFN